MSVRRARSALLAAVVVTASLLTAACGGSSPSQGSATSAQASASLSRDRALAAHDHSDRIARSGGVAHASQPDLGHDELSPTGAHIQNPCTLVTTEELHAIIHAPIARAVEAPQGPTCIYEPARLHGAYLTLSVQTARFAVLRSHLRHAFRLTIQGRATYCGILGTPTLYTLLSDGQVLTVSAPCQVAAPMVALALPRVKLIAA